MISIEKILVLFIIRTISFFIVRYWKNDKKVCTILARYNFRISVSNIKVKLMFTL